MQLEYFSPKNQHNGLLEVVMDSQKEKAKARARRSALSKKNKPKKKADNKPYLALQIKARQKTIDNNKENYKEVYKLFFDRGGPHWYESLTGKVIDLDLIYYDIKYFQSCLMYGIRLEKVIFDKKQKINRYKQLLVHAESEEECDGVELSSHDIRRLLVIAGTPAWADKDKIKEKYEERDRLRVETGISHAVDHIVPIKHDLVCGLNVEFNLQVIKAQSNMRKGNKFSVENHDRYDISTREGLTLLS